MASALVRRLDQPEQLKALAHPLRLRILRILITQAATVEELADKLRDASGRVHYHVKTLERHGLIRLVSTRQKRSIVEKEYRAVASAFQVESTYADASDALATYMALWRDAEAKATEFLATLEPDRKQRTDLFLFKELCLSPRRAEGLVRVIERLIAQYASRPSPAGAGYHIALTIHPLPARARRQRARAESHTESQR